MRADKTSDKHHRRCRSNGGTNSETNISVVDSKQHSSWHNLFQAMDAYQIAQIINNVWLQPEFYFEVKRRKS